MAELARFVVAVDLAVVVFFVVVVDVAFAGVRFVAGAFVDRLDVDLAVVLLVALAGVFLVIVEGRLAAAVARFVGTVF